MLTLFAANLSEETKAALEFLKTRGREIGLNLIGAVLIYFIGRWVARILTRYLQHWMSRGNLDQTLAKFTANIAYGLMMIVVIAAALDRMGVETTSLAAVIAAAGLAVGLALQGSLSNFASGFLIILFRPFKVGDYVEAGGTSGTVVEVMLLHTVLKTPNNVQVIVPNKKIGSDTITNYSVNPTRRIDLVVGCGYDDDLKAVKTFLEEVLKQEERVLAEPAPSVAVSELADSSVNLVVRPWVKREDYWSTKCDLVEKIKLGFDERGFSIPFPQQDVHLHQVSAG